MNNEGPSKKQYNREIKTKQKKPAGLHKELSDKLRDKKVRYKKWKEAHITKAEYQQRGQICKEGIRKAKPRMS